jgi:cell division protein FtsQ
VLALLGGGWIWLRHSSLVAVKRVLVAGVSGPDAAQIRAALISEARTMTTLDVQLAHLRTAVSPYPVVKHLEVSTQFPHGMRIRVIEQVPVATVDTDGRRTAVAGDGTLLSGVLASTLLPTINLAVAPGGTRLTGAAQSDVRMLAAAPYALLAKVASASSDSVHGLVAQLRNGPKVYFGGAGQLTAKWSAVAEVLASSSSAGADYIDVTVPTRPVAGTGSDGAATTGSGVGTAPATNGDSTAGTATTG